MPRVCARTGARAREGWIVSIVAIVAIVTIVDIVDIVL